PAVLYRLSLPDALPFSRAFLIDDRVDRDGGFAGLAVADDQLALTAADRDHRVDRFVAGLHRLRNRFPPDHARCDLLDRRGALRRSEEHTSELQSPDHLG